MNLPELCIRRPVMTTLLMLAFLAAGLFGYRLLPVAALPQFVSRAAARVASRRCVWATCTQ